MEQVHRKGYHFIPSPRHSLLPPLFRWLGQESLLSLFPKDSMSHKAASHRFIDYPTIYFSTSSVLTGSGRPSRLCPSAIIFVSCASSMLRGISSDTTAEAVFGVIRETPAVDHPPLKDSINSPSYFLCQPTPFSASASTRKDTAAVGTNLLLLSTLPAIRSPATVEYTAPFCSLVNPRAFSSPLSDNSKSALSPS